MLEGSSKTGYCALSSLASLDRICHPVGLLNSSRLMTEDVVLAVLSVGFRVAQSKPLG